MLDLADRVNSLASQSITPQSAMTRYRILLCSTRFTFQLRTFESCKVVISESLLLVRCSSLMSNERVKRHQKSIDFRASYIHLKARNLFLLLQRNHFKMRKCRSDSLRERAQFTPAASVARRGGNPADPDGANSPQRRDQQSATRRVSC